MSQNITSGKIRFWIFRLLSKSALCHKLLIFEAVAITIGNYESAADAEITVEPDVSRSLEKLLTAIEAADADA